MKMNTGITFKVYLMAEAKGGKEEGWLLLWKHKGNLVKPRKLVPFNNLEELSGAIKGELARTKIKWPK